VLRGQCQLNAHAAKERDLLFVAPDDDAPEITAGAQGASILVMQFPRRD
jgi:hypothetical protein